jgi:heme A synthase
MSFTWFLLAYLLAVILWGAYVRATGSGAGCGNHWPLCNGQVIPLSPNIETIIEFVHRFTSGVGLLLVVVLVIWAFKIYPKGSLVRLFAGLTMTFMVTEALVGAGLVLFGLVAEDDSFARAWVMSFHLVNTFLLIGCLSLTGWYGSGAINPDLKRNFLLRWLLLAGLVTLMLLGASGAVTALGDTLFPSESLSEALEEDFSPAAHLLIHLRIYHPILALLIGFLMISVSVLVIRLKSDSTTRNLAFLVSFLYLLQLGIGLFNLLLLAPIWLQLIHLLFADLTWIGFVLLSASALAENEVNGKR